MKDHGVNKLVFSSTSAVYGEKDDGKHMASASYERVYIFPGRPGRGGGRVGGYPPADQTVKVWDAASGREVLSFTGHRADIVSLAFSPDGKILATASWDKTVKLWDAATGQEITTLKGHLTPCDSWPSALTAIAWPARRWITR